jgi:hypothetical protein
VGHPGQSGNDQSPDGDERPGEFELIQRRMPGANHHKQDDERIFYQFASHFG